MKRVFIILLFILFIFLFPKYIILPIIFLVTVLSSYIFYEIILFGLIFDIILSPAIPFYTLLAMLILALSLVIRKRMLIHV